MWMVLFIVALLFVLGSTLMLLRSAKMPEIPDNVKAQPYEEENDGRVNSVNASSMSK